MGGAYAGDLYDPVNEQFSAKALAYKVLRIRNEISDRFYDFIGKKRKVQPYLKQPYPGIYVAAGAEWQLPSLLQMVIDEEDR